MEDDDEPLDEDDPEAAGVDDLLSEPEDDDLLSEEDEEDLESEDVDSEDLLSAAAGFSALTFPARESLR